MHISGLLTSIRKLLGHVCHHCMRIQYKKDLIKTVNAFKKDVTRFRAEYERSGPMVKGIPPREAVERLKRFKEEFEVRDRKQEIYYIGEDLFGVPHQRYPSLDTTRQELGYLSQLYVPWNTRGLTRMLRGSLCGCLGDH